MIYKITLSALLISSLLFFSCSALPESIHLPESVRLSDTDSEGFPDMRYVTNSFGYSLEIRYMDRAELEKRHGDRGNPFLHYPSIVTAKDIVVFELSIKAGNEALFLRHSDALLSIGSKSSRAMTADRFESLWEIYDDQSRESGIRKKIIEQNLERGIMILEAGESLSTYLVFADSFPEEGEAVLSLDLFCENGGESVIDIPISSAE